MCKEQIEKTRFNSGSVFEEDIGFSRAVRSGPLIVVSGTAPVKDDGKTAFPGDVYKQTRQCLEIVKRAITEVGGSLETVTRTRIMLVDISKWQEAAKAHREVFGSIRPACTFVQVAGFIDPTWLVETEAECFESD